MPVSNGITTPVASAIGEAGQVKSIGRAISVAVGQTAINTVIPALIAPRGFVVTGLAVRATDMDTGGSPALALHVGDADDPDRFLSASTIAQTGTGTVTLAVTGAGFKYTVDTAVNVTVSTGAATGAAGTLSVYLIGFFDL